MSENREIKNIDPELYRHPSEREALDSLKKIPGFAKAVSMLSEGPGGKADRQVLAASAARVGPGVYPALNTLWVATLDQFGLRDFPLHIACHAPQACALRGGNDHPVLVLSSDLLEALPEREMAVLLAMQAGTVRLGNATNLAAAEFLRWVSDFSGLFGAPAAVLAWGVETWRRQAAFSADRAAALALGDPASVVSFLERLAGGGIHAWGGIADPDSLRLQGIEANSLGHDWSNNRWRRFTLAMNRQNNAALVRRLDLLDWLATGDPGRILRGELVSAPKPAAEAGKAKDASGKTDDTDPNLAFWGEFASGGAAPGEVHKLCPMAEVMGMSSCPMAEMMGAAQKGVGAFWKAGESFMKAVQEKMRQ